MTDVGYISFDLVIKSQLEEHLKKIQSEAEKPAREALSGHIQAFIDTAYSFVTTFDWSGFGDAFGTAINGWFECMC